MAAEMLRTYARQITQTDGIEYPDRHWRTHVGFMFLATKPEAVEPGLCESEVLTFTGPPPAHHSPKTIGDPPSTWHMAVEDKYRIVGPTDAPDTEIEEAKTAKLCQQQHSPEYFFSFYGSFGSATASANRVSEAISYIRKHKIRQSDPRYSRITTDRLWYVITDPCFDLSSYVEKAYHSVTGITVRYEYTCYNIEMGTPNNGLYGEVLKFRTIEEFDKRTESRIKYDVDNIEYTNGK